MTVFDCESMSSAPTSTPKKDCVGGCACGKMTSFATLKDLSSGFSFRSLTGDSVCEKADDVFDSEADAEFADSHSSGSALQHDHSYTKWQPRKVSSASLDSSADMDESLQNLFETCEIDREFLAEAKPAFRQFLDDVLDSSDVPATEDLVFFDLDDSSCRVPTRSSSLCLVAPPASPCLFTCAGSTHTVLSASVATGLRLNDTTTPTSHLMTSPVSSSSSSSSDLPVPLFDCSLSSPSSSSSSSSSSFPFDACSASDFTPPSVSDSSALDSKLKDVIDFLFSDSACGDLSPSGVTSGNASDVTSFLKEMDDVTCCGGQKSQQQQPLSFSDTMTDDFVWPVTMSHRIQNGVCVSCSAPQRHSGKGGEGLLQASDASPRSLATDNAALASHAPSPAVTSVTQSQQQHDHHSSSSSTATTTCTPSLAAWRSGKRKLSESDEESEVCDKRARLEPSLDKDTDQACSTRWALSATSITTTSTTTSQEHACSVDRSQGVSANKLSLSLDLSDEAIETKRDDAEKRPQGVLDYLSFVRNAKLPLSPINLHHFGRHG